MGEGYTDALIYTTLMSLFQKIKTSLHDDPLFRRVLNNSLHLFSSNTISMGLGVVESALVYRLLGPTDAGLIGVIVGYASTVNSLFSFRMSEVVVRYGGEYLEKEEKDKASALIKAAGLTEAAVSLLAFIVVLLTAGLAELHLSKTPNTAYLFMIFALGLLANFNTETSTGILQITNRIKLQGTINLIQSVITLLVVVSAFIWHGGLGMVLLAQLLGKSIIGLGLFIAAQIQLHQKLNRGWWRTSLKTLGSTRDLIRFAISSNISATIIKIFRESEPVWIGYFLSTTAVGYYGVAYKLVSFLSIPADPLIATTFPEINRLSTQKAWARLKDFLRKITTVSLVYNLALALGFILFGHWIIILISDARYLPAYPVLIVLVIGLTFNYTLFWNRPLLLSLGLPTYPIRVTLIVGLIKIALAFIIVPRYGIVAAGALLSFYYIASVGIMAWRGMREIQHQEASA